MTCVYFENSFFIFPIVCLNLTHHFYLFGSHSSTQTKERIKKTYAYHIQRKDKQNVRVQVFTDFHRSS